MYQEASVLVVDDDRNVRDAMTSVLENEGYVVCAAENGAQALASMLRTRPLAVLLDLTMPIMTGWELLDAIRHDGELSQIPIVVLSSMRAPEGVTVLSKPVHAEDLVAALEPIRQRGAMLRAIAGTPAGWLVAGTRPGRAVA